MQSSQNNIILHEDIQFNNISYMDPNGRIFEWKNDIYRALYPEAQKFYRKFIQSDTNNLLQKKGQLVETVVTDFELDGFGTILKHKRLEQPSYCFEWSPVMLKEAALLTIEMCIDLVEQDAILQDAYPWNILFEGTKPIFVDFTSIVQTNKAFLWIPYQQFCNFFYHPLLLYSAEYGFSCRRLLFNYLDGISNKEVRNILKLRHKLRLPGYLARVTIPGLMAKMLSSEKWETRIHKFQEKSIPNISNSSRVGFFKKLYKTIDKIKLVTNDSNWKDYYEETEKNALKEKKNFVHKVLANISPKRVLDIGSNTGVFSIMAAENGADVTAFDSDEVCISNLFMKAKEKNLSILPLIMDILNPSPNFGWCGKQFLSAADRFKADLVFAFAIMHHMAFTHGQDFNRIIESIKLFQKDYALFEYVDKGDKMAECLRRRISFNDDWYNKENFLKALNQHYRSVEIIGDVSPTRTLILCRL